MTPAPPAMNAWDKFQQIESVAGEARANLIRLAAIIAFYGNHFLQNIYLEDIDARYHQNVTFIAMFWFLSVIVVHFWLRTTPPPWLKYLISFWDIALITMLLILRESPQNSLLLLYFIVISMAALRWDLRLIQATTAATVFGYLSSLSYYVTQEVGTETYYTSLDVRIPRSEQIITVLSLIAVGFVVGQIVRQVRLALGHIGLEAAPQLEPETDQATETNQEPDSATEQEPS